MSRPKRAIEPLPFYDEEARAEDEAIGAASFVLSLRARGIRDTAVLRAMELVPREVFAPRRFADLARKDVALPLPCGQTMTAPGTVAAMLVALGVAEGHKVLEIGTGSGYVTALLASFGAKVKSVERFGALAEAATGHLAVAGVRGAKIEVRDGLGVRPRERFDRILVNGAGAEIPDTVRALLAPGGRLVGARTIDGIPRLLTVERSVHGDYAESLGGALRLSPLLTGVAGAL